ncbi:MAG: hypothetical protein ACOH2Q_19280 [Rhodococcus sp. (in: high G+C Gram-positive bacteria)]
MPHSSVRRRHQHVEERRTTCALALAKVDIGKHIRHTLGWAWLISLGMLGVAMATGAIPLWSS